MADFRLATFRPSFPRPSRIRLLACLRWCLAAGIVVLAMLQSPLPAAAAKVKLVPARYGQVNDAQGYPWDVRSTGMIENGRNDCFDNGLILTVNNQQFNCSNGQMTPDAKQFVLFMTMGQLQVTRHIQIDTQRAMMRYLEVFNNPTAKTVNAQVVIRTMLGGNCQQVVTSEGTPLASATLGKKDIGIAAMNPGGSRPSVVFMFSDPNSRPRPTVRVQGNRDFYVTFSLSIKPKRTLTLYHTVAQRSNLTPNGLAAVYKTVYRGRLLKPSIPAKLVSTIANFRTTPAEGDPGPLLASVLEVADALGVERKDHETLVLSDDASMTGTVTSESFVVKTLLGDTKIEAEDVALLVGGAGRERPMRLYLRSGEILVGEIQAESLAIKTKEELQLKLEPALLDMLFFRANQEKDGKPLAGAAAMVTTSSGDRFAVAKTASTMLKTATPWGAYSFKLNAVRHMWVIRDPAPSRRLVLNDNSRLTVFVTSPALPLESVRWGTVQLPMHALQAYHRIDVEAALEIEGGTPEEIDEDPEFWRLKAPYCLLAGNNAFAGRIDLESIRLVSGAGVRDVALEQIATISRDEDQEQSGTQAAVRLEMRGGGHLTGRLERSFVPIRVGEHTWQVPVEHLALARFIDPPPEEEDVEDEEVEEEGAGEDESKKPVDSPLPAPAPAAPQPAAAAPTADPFGGTNDPFENVKDPFK